MKIITIILISFIVALGGCVGTKKYDTAIEESSERLTEIEMLKAALDKAAKANEKLSSESNALSKELDAVNNDKVNLIIERKDSERTLAALKASLEERENETDYLNREVERLSIKAGELSKAKEMEVSKLKGIYDDLVKELNEEIEQGDVRITQAIDRLSLKFVEKILFASGKAEIKPEGLKVLKRMGDILKEVAEKQIRVEGHTDNVPIGEKLRKTYPTNWELSTARSTKVVRYLQDNVGIDPGLLSVGGYSKYRPEASNETEEGRMMNRRIEIVLLPQNIDRVLKELKK